jgi:uncharacterized protein (DUF2252 family)
MATPAARAAAGRAVRAKVPRSAHARFEASDRDPVALLEDQAAGRVPDLLPVRYGRMLRSPLSFYRGSALLMADDLAGTPDTGIRVQLCGDAHLSNFGLFGTPERRLVFDLNDFDETQAGPWEWDVKRLAASLAITAAQNGFSARQRRAVVSGTVERYRLSMAGFAAMGNLTMWYASVDADELRTRFGNKLTGSERRELDKTTRKARRNDSSQAVVKLTRKVGGQLRIDSDAPLLVPIRELVDDGKIIESLTTVVEGYMATLRPDRAGLLREYRIVDAARKVVGVGSVGNRAWVILLIGCDDEDPLMLQAKEAQASVLARYLGPAGYDNQGERVVAGQQRMQAASDMFLGWNRADGRDYYVRQLRDWKGTAVVESMGPTQLGGYGALCGWTLARAHARTGDRFAVAGYLGSGQSFDRAVTEFADAYLDRNDADYRALQKAAQDGRIEARSDL